MIRNCLNKTLVISALLPLNLADQDIVTKDSKTAREADFSTLERETGWDRLYHMFSRDEFGRLTPELNTVFQVGCMSTFIGALYGGFIHSRTTYMDFIKNNQATVFRDHLEAKKRLQDSVTLSFGKGALKWAWRLTYFSTTYVGISTSISIYRGKSGMVEHMIAGLVTGSIYRFNLGPRGWIVGGGLGLALGIIAGGCTTAILKLSGMTMEEVRYWQYHWKESRTNYFNKGVEKYMEKEQLIILTEHNKKIGEAGKNLDNIFANTDETKKS